MRDSRGPWSIGRHRWTALWNGLIIGMGIIYIVIGNFLGVVLLAVGIGMAVWHRRRAKSQER